MKEHRTVITETRMVADGVDKRIIELLNIDFRMTLKEMGSKIGITDVAICKRLNKIQELGAIKWSFELVEPKPKVEKEEG